MQTLGVIGKFYYKSVEIRWAFNWFSADLKFQFVSLTMVLEADVSGGRKSLSFCLTRFLFYNK